jgi:hypothetical protein
MSTKGDEMMPAEYSYENLKRVIYGDKGTGGAWFIPVCPNCGRFVKADSHLSFNGLGEYQKGANATCSKCGRVEMPFEGYY